MKSSSSEQIVPVVWWQIADGAVLEDADPNLIPTTPSIPANALVVLTGRGPIWRYGMAWHRLHGTASAVGTYEPSRKRVVVIYSHIPNIAEGALITCEEFEEFCLYDGFRKTASEPTEIILTRTQIDRLASGQAVDLDQEFRLIPADQG